MMLLCIKHSVVVILLSASPLGTLHPKMVKGLGPRGFWAQLNNTSAWQKNDACICSRLILRCNQLQPSRDVTDGSP